MDSGSYAYADTCRVQPVPAPDTSCTQSVSDTDTEVRLGKDRIDKDRIEQESHTGRAAIQARPDGASEHPAASGGGMPPAPEDLEEYHHWLMAPFQRHIVPGGELKC